jgi:4-hydroxybenzoate polyprenyltransferase
MSRLRTLLQLGRLSNLPTVWSNCLAGWWLGGGGNFEKLPFLFVGATFLYIGGMYLNDAFDADFDRQHRGTRPIPSGAISVQAVWRWSLAWLAAGSIGLIGLGKVTGMLGVALLLCILAYNALHKLISFAPVLMGICRMLLYVIAASTGVQGVTGWALWCGLALATYVIGLSCLARGESTGGPAPYWPLVLLAAPVPLALIMNTGIYREPGILLSLILVLWTIRSLRPALWSKERNVGAAVANLLAGIVFVDLLAIADASREFALVFFLLFGLALLLQRVVPAT